MECLGKVVQCSKYQWMDIMTVYIPTSKQWKGKTCYVSTAIEAPNTSMEVEAGLSGYYTPEN